MGSILLWCLALTPALADEGMWVLKELNKQNLARMKELGFNPSYEQLYSETDPCVANAVVIFGGGCTGITVSNEGLIFTNHHCGYGSIQQLSSVEHDYLKDGFVSQSKEEELPVPGLTVRYLRETIDVTDRIVSEIEGIGEEYKRVMAADSIGQVLCDSIGTDEFKAASVVPFYSDNKYYLVVYNVFRDVRMVFAPPSSVGKFGGDTDNWMWPRHTGDFSVFRVYANANNEPAEYAKENKPYQPKYVAEVSLQGYTDKDYAMTIGFPGSTSRYLCSWGVQQRIESENEPRIEVRGIKQDIWKRAMSASDAVRIKYASKYAGSSNYWKNSIGMNKGLARLGVIARKQEQEKAFAAWVAQDAQRKAKYGNVLKQLEEGYTSSDECQRALVYLMESLERGTEIVGLARMVNSFDPEGSTAEERRIFLEDRIQPFFKDYEPTLDQEVLAAMMQIAKQRIPAKYLPDVFTKIDKKYKGDYNKFAADLKAKSVFMSEAAFDAFLEKPDMKKLEKDLAYQAGKSFFDTYMKISASGAPINEKINRGNRLFVRGLMLMNPEKAWAPDANSTIRMTYGKVGSYKPRDAVFYDYYTTLKGVMEKEGPAGGEFEVPARLKELYAAKDFAPYGADFLSVNFITDNDITGGNSGSPVINGEGHLIGTAFDGNSEAMSGDIDFEENLQRCINLDTRYMLWIVDKYAGAKNLINEMTIIK